MTIEQEDRNDQEDRVNRAAVVHLGAGLDRLGLRKELLTCGHPLWAKNIFLDFPAELDAENI